MVVNTLESDFMSDTQLCHFYQQAQERFENDLENVGLKTRKIRKLIYLGGGVVMIVGAAIQFALLAALGFFCIAFNSLIMAALDKGQSIPPEFIAWLENGKGQPGEGLAQLIKGGRFKFHHELRSFLEKRAQEAAAEA